MIDNRIIESEAEVSPYKKLLGAVFRQVIEDAVWSKYYQKLWCQYKNDPDSCTKDRVYWLEDKRHIANTARYFIFSKQLDRAFKFWKMDISTEYFRRKFLKLERAVVKNKRVPKTGSLPSV